jgi:hypothetical protein
MKPRIIDIQLGHIIDLLKPQNCPDQSLRKVQSIVRRDRLLGQALDSADVMRFLGDWLSRSGSSLFTVRVGPRADTKVKKLAVDVIELLISTEYAVFWDISQPMARDNEPSMADLLKSLVYQALKNDPNILRGDLETLCAAKLRVSHTESEWRSLLVKIFSQVSKSFIIIDAHDLFRVYEEDSGWIAQFFKFFQDLIDLAEASDRSLKILIIGSWNGELEMKSASQVNAVVHASAPIPPRLRKSLGRVKRHSGRFYRLRPGF